MDSWTWYDGTLPTPEEGEYTRGWAPIEKLLEMELQEHFAYERDHEFMCITQDDTNKAISLIEARGVIGAIEELYGCVCISVQQLDYYQDCERRLMGNV